MQIPLLNLKRQYLKQKTEIDKAILSVMADAHYILGDNVRSFECEFAEYLGVRHAVSVGNGTDALVIALKALSVGPGDEVITSPYTFFATVEAIFAVGAKPVFVDVNEIDYNIDPLLLEAAITERTKGIIPVHIFGQCAQMNEINRLARDNQLFVLEDACQAAGAMYDGKKAGAIGDISTFSFFPTKNLGCAGDGGMICTNNDDLADICKALRAHGSGAVGLRAKALLEGHLSLENEPANDNVDNTVYNAQKYYNYLSNAQNSRLDELQAAVLRQKLPLLDLFIDNRRKIAEIYNSAFKSSQYMIPKETTNAKHSYHLYILQSGKRQTVCEMLKSRGIATGIYYPVPMHLQIACESLGYSIGDLPVAEHLSQRTFAIPLFPEMTQDEWEYVIDSLYIAEGGL